MSSKDHPNTIRMDPADVTWGTVTTTSGRRRVRHSRADDTRSLQLFLKHVPTGIQIEGEVPPGHYSRKVLREKQAQLCNQLLPRLEKRVLDALRRQRTTTSK